MATTVEIIVNCEINVCIFYMKHFTILHVFLKKKPWPFIIGIE